MAEVTDGAILAAIFDGRHNGQQMMVTTHWRMKNLSGSAAADAFTSINAIFSQMEGIGGIVSSLPSVMSEEVNTIRWVLQWIYPTRFRRVIKVGLATEGEVAGAALPENDDVVITVQTDDTGRTQRGDKHIGGVPVSYVVNGFVTDVALPLYNGVRDVLVSEFNVTDGIVNFDMEPVIFHKANPVLSPVITAGYTQQDSRIMRRRSVGLGS